MIDEKLKHIAIIMDGNGRWATKRHLSRSMGHKEGFNVLEDICNFAFDEGLKVLSVYAFSTDNFKRSQDEVDYLMNLFVEKFRTRFRDLMKKGVKIVFSGGKENLRDDVLEAMELITNESKNNEKAVLNICLNYGGREEIIRASKRYHEDLLKGDVDIDRESFTKYLDNDLPPIDILIRTGGEKRLSNFMLYELSYAEIYFIEKLFPDFRPNDLIEIVNDFYKRDRRFGGINEKKE